jgi:hypothetical protein
MKKLLLATAIITIAFTAYKKSSVETPAPDAPTHLGLWKGKYSTSANLGQLTNDVFLLLTKDGNAKVYNGSDTTNPIQKSISGQWNISGVKIIIQYRFTSAAPLSMRFFTDDNFTKSLGLSADEWGTGDITQNNYSRTGFVSFTKP